MCSFSTGDRCDRRDYEENLSSEGRQAGVTGVTTRASVRFKGQAGVTGVTEIALGGMSVTPVSLLGPTLFHHSPSQSPLSPLSHPPRDRCRTKEKIAE